MNWNDEDLDLALRDLRDEEAPGAALAQVRARILAEVRPARMKWWRWAWVPALAAALAIVAVIPSPAPPIDPPPLLARAPAAQPLSRPVPRRPKPIPPMPETQFARILTDDPNVVILWALNTEGESQ
ncbi:MAG: hypothetical protein IPP47_08005 [Bryobacterales bacterium]|nr:hypothetical protein [Bryobacterales bacterium]